MTNNVYHIINGKRELKPGNKRDPNRRYSQVSDVSTGESYYLEFTPE